MFKSFNQGHSLLAAMLTRKSSSSPSSLVFYVSVSGFGNIVVLSKQEWLK